MYNGNKFINETEKEGILYPDWKEMAKSLPQLFMVTRASHNGQKVGKIRKNPDAKVLRGEGRWRTAYAQQAMILQILHNREESGMLPIIEVTASFGDILIKGDMFEAFLCGNGAILADLIANGWEVTAP